MDRQNAQLLADAFLDALELSPDSQLEIRRWVAHQFDQTAALLPAPDTWTVLGRGERAALLMLAGDAVFTITREAPRGQELQLVASRQSAAVTDIRYWREGQTTVWRFDFRDRDPLEIDGRIHYRASPDEPETFDATEAFARSLAARAGWNPDQQPIRTTDVSSTRESVPARSESPRQQVTDLWGNPLSKRRKR
jgi:hypothetical protein